MRVAMQSAVVENDTSSNSRLTKRSTNQTERDDNVSALVLACGLRARMPKATPFQMLTGTGPVEIFVAVALSLPRRRKDERLRLLSSSMTAGDRVLSRKGKLEFFAGSCDVGRG